MEACCGFFLYGFGVGCCPFSNLGVFRFCFLCVLGLHAAVSFFTEAKTMAMMRLVPEWMPRQEPGRGLG